MSQEILVPAHKLDTLKTELEETREALKDIEIVLKDLVAAVYDKKPEPLLGIADAAEALVNDRELAGQQRLRRRIRKGMYRWDKEVFNLAQEGARKRLHFDIDACRRREREWSQRLGAKAIAAQK